MTIVLRIVLLTIVCSAMLLRLNTVKKRLTSPCKIVFLSMLTAIICEASGFMHELGHAVVATLVDVKVTDIRVTTGGYAILTSPIPEFLPPLKLFLIAVSGSLVNALLQFMTMRHLDRTKNRDMAMLTMIIFISNVTQTLNALVPVFNDAKGIAISISNGLGINIFIVFNVQMLILLAIIIPWAWPKVIRRTNKVEWLIRES